MPGALGSIPTAEGAVSATIAGIGCCWLGATAKAVINLQHVKQCAQNRCAVGDARIKGVKQRKHISSFCTQFLAVSRMTCLDVTSAGRMQRTSLCCDVSQRLHAVVYWVFSGLRQPCNKTNACSAEDYSCRPQVIAGSATITRHISLFKHLVWLVMITNALCIENSPSGLWFFLAA